MVQSKQRFIQLPLLLKKIITIIEYKIYQPALYSYTTHSSSRTLKTNNNAKKRFPEKRHGGLGETLGALRVYNEETLAAEQQMTYVVQETQWVLLLPLVGGIEVQVEGKTYEMEAGGLLELPLAHGAKYQVRNPYSDLVSYLQIELQSNDSGAEVQLHVIDLEQHHNALQAILPTQKSHQLSIGKFAGRVDIEHFLTKAEQTAFVFVIDGVFEVQNRLLHARDALLLRPEISLEFEALANEAILLILEF